MSLKFSRELFTEGFALLVIRVVNTLLGVLTVSLFARWMGAEEYGRYVFALTVGLLLSLPLHMGLPTLLTREIAAAIAVGRADVAKGLLTWSLRLIAITTAGLLGLGLAGSGLVWSLGQWQLPTSDLYVIGVSVGIAVTLALQQRSIGILSGMRRLVLSQIPEGMVRPVILLVLGVLALQNWEADYRTILGIYLLASIISMSVGFAFVRHARPASFAEPGRGTIQAHWLWDLLPFTMIAAIATLNNYSDILLLGAMLPLTEVAHYKVATLIGLMPLALHGIGITMLMPRAATAWKQGNLDHLTRLGRQVSRVSFGIALLYGVGFVLLGQQIIDLFLGPEYAKTYQLTLAILLVPLLMTVAGSSITILNMSNHAGITAKIAAAAAVSNVAFGLLFIPLFGVMGAAMSSIVSVGILNVSAWWLVRVRIGVRCDVFA